MVKFIVTYGTLIIAAIALAQPWIIALYKRYFRKGSVEIYESANIEIGYSLFGPTIGILGTLRCLNRDQFIKTIQLELVKEKDKSTHLFEWGVFRSNKISIGSEQQATLEVPASFMISTAVPYRFNIQFHDLKTKNEMQSIIAALYSKWSKLMNETSKEALMELMVKTTELKTEFQDPYGALHSIFSKSDIHVQSFTSLDRICYWEPGTYYLNMKVKTSTPEKSFKKEWCFNLNEEEVKLIRLNAIKMLLDTCGRPNTDNYFFVYTKYEE